MEQKLMSITILTYIHAYTHKNAQKTYLCVCDSFLEQKLMNITIHTHIHGTYLCVCDSLLEQTDEHLHKEKQPSSQYTYTYTYQYIQKLQYDNAFTL